MPIRRCFFVLFFLFSAALMSPAFAEGGLLWGGADREPLIVARGVTPDVNADNRPTLFIGRQGSSLFAPYPVRVARFTPPTAMTGGVTPASRIRDLIARAEAGSAGYDAVVWAARIKPPKPPTQMTVGQIYDWIVATPNQHHAIGRYQFIPATLRRLVSQTGAGREQPFTPAFQNQLADILLADAGIHAFQNRDIGQVTFMNNLAKIWAGLPNASGRSHYHGVAGNRATMSWAKFHAEMTAIYAGQT